MPQNVYTSCSPIIVGCFLYTDSGLTTPAPNGVYSDGVDVYTVTGGAGEVTATALCDNFTTTTTTTTTTTQPPTTTTTTSTTTTTTTPPPTTTTTTSTTTTTTTTVTTCNSYNVVGTPSINIEWFDCDGTPFTQTVGAGGITICAETGTVVQTGGSGSITDLGDCTPTTTTTTSTTTTTTTQPPTTTTTTSTSTTTTTLFSNLFFDGSVSNCGYYITAIDVNSVAPTLTGGADVPFCTDGHNYNTTQTGTNETLNLTIGTYTLNGCITVVDSASNSFQQNVTGNGTLAFTGLTINNTTAVVITLADNAC